jgi:hypothetical protein
VGCVRGLREFHAAEFRAGFGARGDDRPLATGAGLPVVAGEKMSNKGVDFAALVTAEFAVFVHRNVLAPPGFLGVENRSDRVAFQLIQQFAVNIQRHGGKFYRVRKSLQQYFSTG